MRVDPHDDIPAMRFSNVVPPPPLCDSQRRPVVTHAEVTELLSNIPNRTEAGPQESPAIQVNRC